MRRQRHHVVVGASFAGVGTQALFAAAARQEQRQREGLVVLAAAGLDEQLLDRRQGVARQLAADAGVCRHHAPALHRDADAVQLALEHVAAMRGLGLVVRQEHQAGGEARIRTQHDVGLVGERTQERGRFADQQAATVAGQSVGGHAAAVGHARKRGDRRVDQRAGGLVVELGDHAEAAGVAFGVRVVKPVAVAGGHLHLHLEKTGVPGAVSRDASEGDTAPVSFETGAA